MPYALQNIDKNAKTSIFYRVWKFHTSNLEKKIQAQYNALQLIKFKYPKG